MGRHFARHCDFDVDNFVEDACGNFASLELKERSNAVRDALAEHLPQEYPLACDVLVSTLHPDGNEELSSGVSNDLGVRGWAIMPMADFVALRGQDHFELSMDVLRQMTSRFTSEFAVRPFIAADPMKAVELALKWAKSDNHHERRLASEGWRPRLPWGMRLNCFVDEPQAILPILDKLKDDPSDYVRKSVANCLNDVSKDHPDAVVEVAEAWLDGASTERLRLVKHACRTLIKNGNQDILAVLGFGEAHLKDEALEVLTPVVTLGGALEFRLNITSASTQRQSLIVDFVIHHQLANGQTSPKVFKWSVFDLDAGASRQVSKRHPIKPITTRRYYSGQHRIDIQINGKIVASDGFELVVAQS